MKKTRVLLATIVFSMFLISCGGSSSSSSSSGGTDTGTLEPFFADERALAMEAAKLMTVSDASLNGLWLAFYYDEQPDGPGKDVDDIRFVFQVSETHTEVVFQLCAGAPDGTATTVPKDVNGNIQLPADINILPMGPAPAPIDVSLTSNTELDFGSWLSGYGSTHTFTAIKIRDDSTLPVGTILDGAKSPIDLFCFDHSNATETSDGFKTESGSRAIRAEEQFYSARCLADDTNEDGLANLTRPDSSWARFDTSLGDTMIFQVADNTLTYSCDVDNGVDSATISYDLK